MKYTREVLESALAGSHSMHETLQRLGLHKTGSNHARIKFLIQKSGLLVPIPENKIRSIAGFNKIHWEQILVYNRLNGRKEAIVILRRALVESGVPEVCVKCSMGTIWNGLPIRLQIDHEDGIWINNLRTNLRFLCPNCHSQTPNYGSGNVKKPTGYSKLVDKVCEVCDEEFKGKPSGKPLCSKKCRGMRNGKAMKNGIGTDTIKVKLNPWPNREELIKMVSAMPLTKIASLVGVSDTAVKKKCKRLGIKTHEIGYWTKTRAKRTSPH